MINWLATKLLDVLSSRPLGWFDWAGALYQKVGAWLFDRQMSTFAVWPDGTVQNLDEGEPHFWMTDDFKVVRAMDEGDALIEAARK